MKLDFLLEQKKTGLLRRLIGIELIGKGIARSGYEILNEEGIRIGYVTSGTFSPTLHKAIALGYVNVGYEIIDTEFFIRIRKNNVRAKVVSIPFVK